MTGNASRSAVDLRELAFYASPERACGYLSERPSMSLFADPTAIMSNRLYGRLALYGFRRSGQYLYRPACPGCDSCVPMRLPVADFQPRRSQRRCLARNRDLEMCVVGPGFREEHFHLYRRYIRSRHPGGGMDDPDPERYVSFLTSPWSDTRFHEFRLGTRLMAVAVVDYMEQGLSAVYTYFEPDAPERGLGTYAILRQVEAARRDGHPWIYLGYWIPECDKMRYKDQFRPFEIYREGTWRRGG
jgi:arginine-tRNA-protein transferase